MLWVVIAVGVAGVASGAGVTFGLLRGRKGEEPPPIVVIPDNTVAEKQVEVQIQLTDLDLVKGPCAEAFIASYGDGLCREMFCWMQTRGLDSQTAGASCDAISNLNNTLAMRKVCAGIEDPRAQEDCYQLFRERK